MFKNELQLWVEENIVKNLAGYEYLTLEEKLSTLRWMVKLLEQHARNESEYLQAKEKITDLKKPIGPIV